MYNITINVKQGFSLIAPQHPKNAIKKINMPVPVRNSGANIKRLSMKVS